MDARDLRSYLMEMIGTFAFVFLSAGAVFVNVLSQNPLGAASTAISVGLVTGLSYAAALAVTVPAGGCYLNPSVTLMLWVFKQIDGLRAIGLIAMQLLGSTGAGMILGLVLGTREDVVRTSHMGTPHLNLIALGAEDVTMGPLLLGVASETIFAFLVTLTLLATVIDPRAANWARGWAGRLAPLWVGLMLVAVTIVGLPVTGGAVNPARWLGPALWEMIQQPRIAFRDHAVFWIGPTAGALIAGWVYTSLILPPSESVAPEPTAPAGTASSPVRSTLFRPRK